jgi:hypothetical protein
MFHKKAIMKKTGKNSSMGFTIFYLLLSTSEIYVLVLKFLIHLTMKKVLTNTNSNRMKFHENISED